MLTHITQQILEKLSADAALSDRKRINHNFHHASTDPLQRMLHAMNRGTYVQPHKHENPDKREVFIILTGRVAVLEFDDSGVIRDQITLDRDLGNYGVEIAVGTFHSLIALVNGSVVYEVKDGPYTPVDDKNFASWAPAEGDAGCEQYLAELTKRAGL